MDKSAYYQVLTSAIDAAPEDKRETLFHEIMSQSKNPVIVFGASVWVGYFGVDRFLLGQVGLGLLKLLTLGGLFIWYIVDLFLVTSMTRRRNVQIIDEVMQANGLDWTPSPLSPQADGGAS